MKKINDNTKLIREKNCFAANLNSKKVILNTTNGKYVQLNKTAEFIWDFVTEERTYDELIAAILYKYEIQDKKLIRKEVDEFLQACIKLKLIKLIAI